MTTHVGKVIFVCNGNVPNAQNLEIKTMNHILHNGQPKLEYEFLKLKNMPKKNWIDAFKCHE